MSKLNNIELNVLEVALDHMEEHLNDLHVESIAIHSVILHDAPLILERLAALETLKTKLL